MFKIFSQNFFLRCKDLKKKLLQSLYKEKNSNFHCKIKYYRILLQRELFKQALHDIKNEKIYVMKITIYKLNIMHT